MISKYSVDRNIQTDLFRELERLGYSISKIDDQRFDLTRGRGTVSYLIENQDDDGLSFSLMPNLSIFFLADLSRRNEVDEVIKRLNGKSEDILKGVLPEKDRKILRIGGLMMSLPMFGGVCIAIVSYLLYDDTQYIFEETPFGNTVGTVLGLTILVGLIVMIVQTNKMNRKT